MPSKHTSHEVNLGPVTLAKVSQDASNNDSGNVYDQIVFTTEEATQSIIFDNDAEPFEVTNQRVVRFERDAGVVFYVLNAGASD